MTVLEAINSGIAPRSIFNDRLGIGVKKIERLLSNLEYSPTDGCWLWLKALVKGYGVVKIRCLSDSILPVHRVCYELVNGPVSKSLHVHHQVEEPIRCSGRSCGNPEHTRPVTPEEHSRDLTPGSASNIAAHRDHCAAGHPYTAESTRVVNGGVRQCRICDKDRAQRKRDALHSDRPKHAKDPATFKTHCKRGHLLEGDNLRWIDTPWGKQRQCRECIKVRTAESRKRFEQVVSGSLPPLEPSLLQKDFCKHGHEMTPENTYIRPDGTGRSCAACKLVSSKKHQKENREEYLARRRELRSIAKCAAVAPIISAFTEPLDDNTLIARLRAALPPAEEVNPC